MKPKIIYQLSIEDIYTVAEEVLYRKLTAAELKYVEEKIGDCVGWFDIIESLLNEFKYDLKEKKLAPNCG
jgi:hypothetical protein